MPVSIPRLAVPRLAVPRLAVPRLAVPRLAVPRLAVRRLARPCAASRCFRRAAALAAVVLATVLVAVLVGVAVPARAQTPTGQTPTGDDGPLSARVDTASGAFNVRNAPSSVLYDPQVRREAKRGLDALYDMQVARADSLFRAIDARYPAHPVGPFLQGLNVWWTLLLDLPDTSHDARFLALMDEVIARCDRLLDEDADHFDAQFFKGAALGFRGRLRSNRGAWMKAAYDGKRAIDLVRAVAARVPGDEDYGFGKGLYDYYAALIPAEYPSAKAVMWMLPEGDKARGLRLLARTARAGWYVQTEAAYFLLQIHYLYEDDYGKSVRYVRWLREAHPHNPYFHTFEGRVHAKWGRWTQARDAFAGVVARHAAGAPGYTDHLAEVARYHLARDRMMRRDWDAALTHLAALEGLTAGHDDDARYKVLGRLRQGMVYDAQGRRPYAVSRYRSVLAMDDVAGAHARARRYLEAPYAR